MNILVILIPVSLVLGLFGLIGFLWTIKARQYDDPVGEASRILLDTDSPADLGGAGEGGASTPQAR
jgi:cbb3-type cytochrome oxidase maturation protein